jgi:predicted dehydrogenase
MCHALIAAGGELKSVYDPDPAKVQAFCEQFPQVQTARCEAEILEDSGVSMVAAASVPSDRCALGCRVMEHGKDYFVDKAPMTTLEQLDQAWVTASKTGRRYFVYYGERLHNEAAVYASQLVRDGAIGKVLQVLCLAPHRLNAPSRPDWFFELEKYGGILCDIGSHQIEQILCYTDAKDAQILSSRVANFNNPQYPELEDFGEMSLKMDNGASGYARVDWFTPDGLPTWGDGRTVLMGTDGTIEMRKMLDLARSEEGNHIFLADQKKVRHINATGKAGFPFFGQMILDCLNRTETAMTQTHIFKTAELTLKAQAAAIR